MLKGHVLHVRYGVLLQTEIGQDKQDLHDCRKSATGSGTSKAGKRDAACKVSASGETEEKHEFKATHENRLLTQWVVGQFEFSGAKKF